jgi:hypothetical protein
MTHILDANVSVYFYRGKNFFKFIIFITFKLRGVKVLLFLRMISLNAGIMQSRIQIMIFMLFSVMCLYYNL